MKDIGQGLDLVFILVAVLDCDDVDILLNRIAVSRLGCKCIIRNGETVLKSVVAVDDAECYRGKLLRNLRCLNLDDLKSGLPAAEAEVLLPRWWYRSGLRLHRRQRFHRGSSWCRRKFRTAHSESCRWWLQPDEFHSLR